MIDLKDLESPQKIISEIQNSAGRLDILINNAGIMKENTLEDITLQEWNEHITVNLTAPFLLIKHALFLLKKNKGSIVNLGSIEGIGNNPCHTAYGAS